MTTLVVGATGATGKLLVEQLLKRGTEVKVIVRSTEKLSEEINNHDRLSIIEESISDLSVNKLAEHLSGCGAVASCLGHNLSFKGIYGKPHKLVTDAVRKLSEAIIINNSNEKTKFVLMNTTGNRNGNLNEKISFRERLVIGIIRILIPPHSDNERAAEYLRSKIDQRHGSIDWVAVRPDSLTNETSVTKYDVYPSPIRSAIFNSGKTSRINVAHFMGDLIINDEIWNKWKGQMPVVYNREQQISS